MDKCTSSTYNSGIHTNTEGKLKLKIKQSASTEMDYFSDLKQTMIYYKNRIHLKGNTQAVKKIKGILKILNPCGKFTFQKISVVKYIIDMNNI